MPKPTFEQLASGALVGTFTPTQLFAGEAPIITDSSPALADVQKWQLLSLTATGVRPFVYTGAPETDDDPRTAVLAAVEATTGKQVPYYDAGKFNWEVCVFPAALDTLPKIKAALQGSMLKFAHLI